MSILGKVAKAFFVPEGDSEKFTFRRYMGDTLRDFVSGLISEYPASDIETVTLKINPSEIKYDQPRMTQKVQTNTPQRFVVFDWGTDLQVMILSGQTGNLIPDIMTSGLDPVKPIADFVGAKAGVPAGSVTKAANVALDMMLATMSYHEIIGMSPKYRTFVRLYNLYLNFDADSDICVLEFGDFVYRIYFNNFTFTQSADTPWNWKYEITLTVLTELSLFRRKGDDKFSSRSTDRTR